MFSLIPTPYKIIGALLLLMGIVVAAEYDGAARVKATWDAERAAQTIASAKTETAQAAATVQVVTKYVDRIIKVKDVTHENQDRARSLSDTCRLSPEWVQLHDAAALSIPAASPSADDSTTGVEATTALDTIITNYSTANQCREQVMAWQDWAKKMQESE